MNTYKYEKKFIMLYIHSNIIFYNMLHLKTFFIAFIQGFTEFLPISSTAHMILFANLFEIQLTDQLDCIMIGSAFAIIIYYRKILFTKHEELFNLYCKIAIAFIPVATTGFILKSFLKFNFDAFLTPWSLILIGVILMFVPYRYKFNKKDTINSITYLHALYIGLFQVFSIIPGVSRSGITILSAMMMGYSLQSSIKFSFLIAIPSLASVSVYSIYNFGWDNYYLGLCIFTFIISMMTIIKILPLFSIKLIQICGLYRIILGFLILLFCFDMF